MSVNKRHQVNIRLEQELIEEIDRLASEDAVDRAKKRAEDLVSAAVSSVDDAVSAKEKEILTV